MKKPLLRIPYTGPLPPPAILPPSANTLTGAVTALTEFLSAPASRYLVNPYAQNDKTVLLTGAGISVASGLADYRGTKGTYTVNKTYRPIYFNDFSGNHEARKRYWARSFLGWTNLNHSKPNTTHYAIKALHELNVLSSVITQNVDSFHRQAHPNLRTLELHGYLRSTVCLTCRSEYSRKSFQRELAKLNPAWADLLEEALASGALTSEDSEERSRKGLKTNPDGDVDLPGAPYTTFRYPPCPVCLEKPPVLSDRTRTRIDVDSEGSWLPSSTAGILKPAVIMFGESIPSRTKEDAEQAIDEASRILIMGSSLATYSAWRLVKRAKENGMPIGILNVGGARGEETFFADVGERNAGQDAFRASQQTEKVLPLVVQALKDL